VLPVAFAVGGIAFPVGVLLYWTTSNLWTMGQQFYVIRNNPTPGTPAFDAKKARDAKKHHGDAVAGKVVAGEVVTEPDPKPVPPRVQPKKQSRSKRKRK
jgi:YidC/Oxa1 family membrane protein insertase